MAALEFEVLSIFPGAVAGFVETGLMGKALARDLVRLHCTDLREFTHDRHRSVDAPPFGGGAGMVIKAGPVVAALESVIAERGPVHTILLTPSAPRFDQRVAERLALEPRIALLCGRYEGIDDRVREHWVDECLSIGDFVLNGGEVAAALIIEAVARLREGVLGNPDSFTHESFAALPNPEPEPDTDTDTDTDVGDRSPSPGTPWLGPAVDEPGWIPGQVLEHPHYTRPASFRGREVPPVLLGGDHGEIERWRRREACLRTWSLRPDLRPDWRLPADHPVYLAAPSEISPELQTDLSALEVELLLVGRGRSNMRDLKQLRRTVRKRHGVEPWVLGLAEAADPGQALGPRLALDVLAYMRQSPPGPLVLWIGGPAGPHGNGPRGPEAWLALNPEASDRDAADVRTNPRRRLAIPSGLIDISQPPTARLQAASLAQSALSALRLEGLLP